jgi:hypothetical protein
MIKEITEKNFINKLMIIEKFTLKMCANKIKEVYTDENGHSNFRLGEYQIRFINAYDVGNRFITLKGDKNEIWINTVRYNKEFVVFNRWDGKTHFLKENKNKIEDSLIDIYNKVLFSNEPDFISMKVENF